MAKSEIQIEKTLDAQIVRFRSTTPEINANNACEVMVTVIEVIEVLKEKFLYRFIPAKCKDLIDKALVLLKSFCAIK